MDYKTFLQENQLIVPSYQHYGGLTGFQDYGINGCRLKNQVLDLWRRHFLCETIQEVEIPSILSNPILKASGHLDKFTDYVIDNGSGVQLRADHVAEEWFAANSMTELANQVGNWNLIQLQSAFDTYPIMPNNYYPVVTTKNLMIGADSGTQSHLRPELAQGIFINFHQYLTYNQATVTFRPFGIAQIGKSYRKEISPQPYTRLREFTQAEIEYLVDPQAKIHVDFDTYANTIVPILTADMQSSGCEPVLTTIRDAVANNLISHQLMAYFIAKIYQFARTLGLSDSLIRFRQHQSNEMAHYASQCWDLECKVNDNWLECVGCADRGCYDLQAHSVISPKRPLVANRILATPRIVQQTIIKLNHNEFNQTPLVKSTKAIAEYLVNLDAFDSSTHNLATNIAAGQSITITVDGTDYDLDPSWLTVKTTNVTITHETFTPHVIEPSFGIDRLIYAMIVHNTTIRSSTDTTNRILFSLPNVFSLYDVAVFALHKKSELMTIADEVRETLRQAGFRCWVDNSSTPIGKKYVRCDELSVKYSITIDPGTVATADFTIRDRDTMRQVVFNCNALSNLQNITDFSKLFE